MASGRKTEHSDRRYCAKCGGHIKAAHPGRGVTDVSSAMLPGLEFEPALHANCQEAMAHILDGPPKMQELPAEMGGSGLTLPE